MKIQTKTNIFYKPQWIKSLQQIKYFSSSTKKPIYLYGIQPVEAAFNIALNNNNSPWALTNALVHLATTNHNPKRDIYRLYLLKNEQNDKETDNQEETRVNKSSTSQQQRKSNLAKIIQNAHTLGIPIEYVKRNVLNKLAGKDNVHQGVVTQCSSLSPIRSLLYLEQWKSSLSSSELESSSPPSLSEIHHNSTHIPPLFVALDEVWDPHVCL